LNFKKLEVCGFKSFADKLNVEFDDGITAIVGPNGCGKSNVADAIRWALGEQSAKSLRGSAMQDVIFSGTDTRKSLSYCEVSLHFDNRARTFDTALQDVIISRKLYRSGDSEYLINRETVRYKDVGALLGNSGLGKNSYSIIGQGRIDSILSAKPGDRRAIFEDAAGISRTKESKAESERRLERIEGILQRRKDILGELEIQLGPLERQAADAARFFEVRDRLRHFDINNYIVQAESVQGQREIVQARIAEVEEALAVKHAEFTAVSDEHQAATDRVQSLDTELRKLYEEQYALGRILEQKLGETRNLKDRIAFFEEHNARLREGVVRDNAAAERGQARILALQEGARTRAARMQTVAAELDVLTTRHLNVVDVLKENEEELERAHAAAVSSLTKLSGTRAALSRLTAEKEGLTARLAEFDGRAAALLQRLEADELQLALLTAEREKIRAERACVYADGKSNTERYINAQAEVAALTLEVDKLSQSQASAVTQEKILSQLHRNLEGYAYAVRNVLKAAETDAALKAKVEGVLAQLVRVDQRYEVAVEMVLGNALQNLVTANEEDAKDVINYLKATKGGRVTILPVSAVKARPLHADEIKSLRRKGVVGVAAELVQCDPRYRGIVDNLLGRTVVTETIDVAIQLSRDTDRAFRLVTLDGDIITQQGAMTGGSRKEELLNLLAKEREADNAKAEVQRLSQLLAERTAAKTEAAAGLERLLAATRQCNDAVQAYDLRLATAEEKIDELHRAAEGARTERGTLTSVAGTARERLTALTAEEAAARAEEAALNRAQAGGEAVNQTEYLAYKTERDTLGAQIMSFKVEQAELGRDDKAAREEEHRLHHDIRAYTEQVESANAKLAENRREIEAHRGALAAAEAQVDSHSSERLTAVKGEIAGLDETKIRLQHELARLLIDRDGVQGEINNLTEHRYKEMSELTGIEATLHASEERITEEYKLTWEQCLAFREADYAYNKGIAESARLRRELGRFGSINPNAIEDCARVKDRYTEEKRQFEDDDKAAQELRRIIKLMSTEMVDKFAKQFELIRANFTKVFTELFGGGRADLRLEEAEDPLEAGIEIVAEPPGKRLQSISLLSGGERAMTAIAILFAILRLKAMPFCVLDEIEAALDDANADRFAQYLHKFSQKTQFIVITHRKPTMELADSLYGVTMEEKGVSKIVSVKLSEAVKNAAPGA
jgi:chromosome segregation protein